MLNNLLFLQALCVVHSAPATGKIMSVAANKVGTGVELVISGEGLPKPRVFPFLNGKMRIVEFEAGMAGRGGKTNVNKGAIRSFNTFWYSSTPPKVRINVRLAQAVDPVVVQTESGWKLGFGTGELNASAGLMAKKVDSEEGFPNSVPPLTVVRKEVAPSTSEKAGISEASSLTEKAKEPEAKPKIEKALVKSEPFPNSVPPLTPVKKNSEPTTSSLIQQSVSIDFVNTDIVQVLKAVAIQANVNIVTSPDVKGIVTVSLRNVSVDEALKIVTSLGQLGYAKVGATFIVAPGDKIDAIRRSITGEAAPVNAVPAKDPDVFITYNVKGGLAADLVKAVDEDDKGKAGNLMMVATPAESASAQTIVIRGPKIEAENMIRVLEQLDNADQSASVAEIYDVKFLDPRALREDLIASFPGLRATIAPGPAGNPRIYNPNQQSNQAREAIENRPGQTGTGSNGAGNQTGGDERLGNSLRTGTANLSEREDRGLVQPFTDFESVAVPMRLVLRGSPEQLRAARAYAERLDVQPKQIALELRVMEMSKTQAERIGLDWSILTSGGSVRMLRVNQSLGATAETAGTVGARSLNESILATLDSTSNRQNLIARPNLLALDGRETEVFVGDVIRYIEAIQSTQNGITVQTNEVRVGVRLAVLARAGGNNNITMDLRPILSFLRGFTPTPAGGSLPQTSERIAQSSAVMRSGETIALGGLIQDVDRNNVSGIPILKDLPLIGRLFQRTEKNKDRTEVVFFLTATVVDDATRQEAARPKG